MFFLKAKQTILKTGVNEMGYSLYLIGGLEHEFDFSIYWEFHHPN